MVGSGRRLRLAGVVVAAATLVASAGAAGPGALDRSFGTNGIVTTSFGSSEAAVRALAIQPDGKIVAAGISDTNEGGAFALARYNSDGSLDRSFGAKGKVTTPVGASGTARAVLLLPGGKILAAGSASTLPGPNGSYPDGLAVARYRPDGAPDTSFGDRGLLRSQFANVVQVNDALLQPDGKIVLGGHGSVPEHTFSTGLGLVRLKSDGSPDSSFGTDGEVMTDFDRPCVHCDVNAVAVQPDGRIVAAGIGIFGFAPGLVGPVLVLARYAENGTLEAGFGSAGTLPALDGFAQDMALQPDGKIVLGGALYRAGLFAGSLARYDPDGSLDTSFGSAGMVTRPTSFIVSALTVQPDGKIVAVGAIHTAFALVRYMPNGSLDASFGSGGKVTTPTGFDAAAVTVQPNAKIVAAGSSPGVSGLDFTLVRYLGSGSRRCVVPRVVGIALAQARKRIASAGCRTGQITRRHSSKPKNRVLGQSPRPGTDLASGAAVRLVVSRGPRSDRRAVVDG